MESLKNKLGLYWCVHSTRARRGGNIDLFPYVILSLLLWVLLTVVQSSLFLHSCHCILPLEY